MRQTSKLKCKGCPDKRFKERPTWIFKITFHIKLWKNAIWVTLWFMSLSKLFFNGDESSRVSSCIMDGYTDKPLLLVHFILNSIGNALKMCNLFHFIYFIIFLFLIYLFILSLVFLFGKCNYDWTALIIRSTCRCSVFIFETFTSNINWCSNTALYTMMAIHDKENNESVN